MSKAVTTCCSPNRSARDSIGIVPFGAAGYYAKAPRRNPQGSAMGDVR